MMMPGREYQAQPSRFGFNGKENDNDVKGFGNQQDYGMRIYDPRIGRFLSIDPIFKLYPELTPYQFASNRCIQGIDLDGKEVFLVTGTGNFFGLFAGYEIGGGLAFGKEGIALYAGQTLKGGLGLEIGASVNATLYPTMQELKDLEGEAPGFSISGGYLGRFGVAGSKSSGHWGGTISYGIGAGAHASGEMSFTLALKIIKWEEIVSAIAQNTTESKSLKSFFGITNQNEKNTIQIVKDYFKTMALGLRDKRVEDLNKENRKHQETINASSDFLTTYKKLSLLSRILMVGAKNDAEAAKSNSEKAIEKNNDEIKVLEKTEINF